MPLRREDDLCDPQNLVGVTFAMIDEATGKRQVCHVTYEALCDRASADRDGHTWLGAWERHKSTIAKLASANYDDGKPLAGGTLLVDTDELTPLRPTTVGRAELDRHVVAALEAAEIPQGRVIDPSIRHLGRRDGQPNWTVDLPADLAAGRHAIRKLQRRYDLDIERN